MSSSEEDLCSLEKLLNEFFDQNTGNARKQEIEVILNNFSQRRDAWKNYIYFITHSQNPYTSLYSLTCLETVVNRYWIGLLPEEKAEIRGVMSKMLSQNYTTLQPFQRNKLVKLIVDIGRIDWPHFYSDFFSQILQYLSSTEMQPLGLNFLLTTSEEMIFPREELCMSRKLELRKLLLEQMPHVLNILTVILESMLEKHKKIVTATPPPSPNRQAVPQEDYMHESAPSHLNNHTKTKDYFLPFTDLHCHNLSKSVLNCMIHLFSWIPLSNFITPRILNVLFKYASLGCEEMIDGAEYPLGTLALNVLMEILGKNCVPVEFEEFLLLMFQNCYGLLGRLGKPDSFNEDGCYNIDNRYLEKFTMFLHLFISVHLRRLELNSTFPFLDFLGLIYQFTFYQINVEVYFGCLDIWTFFLDFIITRCAEMCQQEKHFLLNKYNKVVSTLATEVFRKILYSHNQTQLDELDDDSLDENGDTEWQKFLKSNIELIAKVAEIFPLETFSLISEELNQNCRIFDTIPSHLFATDIGNFTLTISSEHECKRLHYILKDISTSLQTLGRLSHFFVEKDSSESYRAAYQFVTRACLIAEFGTMKELYCVKTSVPVLHVDLVDIHVQAYTSLKAWMYWLSQMFMRSTDNHSDVEAVIERSVTSCLPLIKDDVPDRLLLAVAQFLVSLTSLLRPPQLFQSLTMTELLTSTTKLTQVSPQIVCQLYVVLANILLLPWLQRNDQKWNVRQSHLTTLINTISSPVKHIRETPNFFEERRLQVEIQPVIQKTLRYIQAQVESIKMEGKNSKQLLHSSIQEFLHVILWLVPIYVPNTDMSQPILEFFLSVFEVLHNQISVPFAEQTIQIFIDLFKRQDLVGTIFTEGSNGSQALEKFMKILQLIVSDTSSSFKRFIPSTISLCMEHIYPVIASRQSPDVKVPLFELLSCLLLHNWRYFFRSSVLTTLEQVKEEVVTNQEQFMLILQAIGQSFMQPDIHLFRQNLDTLEQLNSKCKLYQRKLFQETMLSQFLTVLFQVLISRSHDLLQDEINITIYNMTSVHLDYFFNGFLTTFLQGCEGLDDNQKQVLLNDFKQDTDLPSFTQNLNKFVNDLRYYRICNTSYLGPL